MTYFAAHPTGTMPKLVGVVGFDGVATLDLTGPLEAFATARIDDDDLRRGTPCYKPIIVGLTSKTFVSDSGVIFKTQETVESVLALDTIIIPGGKGLRDAETNRRISAWLAARADRTRRMASVSTGIYALAQSGLVDGRQVTTHWRFSRDVAQRFPNLRVNCTASFLKDDMFYTSGGGTAGIEMTLALINEDYGAQVALAVARELVMRLRPPGDDQNHFDPSQYQSEPAERLADLPAWMVTHLVDDLSVEALAGRACLCPRHFSRLFKRVFKSTPADFVEQLRLGEARRRLSTTRNSVEGIAASVGFKSADAFRRAFARRLGMTPGRYRRSVKFWAKDETNGRTRSSHAFAGHASVHSKRSFA